MSLLRTLYLAMILHRLNEFFAAWIRRTREREESQQSQGTMKEHDDKSNDRQLYTTARPQQLDSYREGAAGKLYKPGGGL